MASAVRKYKGCSTRQSLDHRCDRDDGVYGLTARVFDPSASLPIDVGEPRQGQLERVCTVAATPLCLECGVELVC